MSARRPGTSIFCLTAVLTLLSWNAYAHPGSGIHVDRSGVVYFVDTGSGVYKLDPQGTLTRIPGPALHWFAVDETNRFAQTSLPSGSGWELHPAGASPTLILSSDYPITAGMDRNLYYPVPAPGGGVQLLRLEPSGETKVFARLPRQEDGRPLKWLNGIAAGPEGSFYYTEDAAIRRVAHDGRVSTLVAGVAPPKCAGLPMEEGARPQLRGMALDSGGNVFVAASGCGSLLKVTPEGKVSVLLQLEEPWTPTAVAVAGSDLFVLEYRLTSGSDRREWTPRIRKLSSDGKSTIVGRIDR